MSASSPPYDAVIAAPIGRLGLRLGGDRLRELDFVDVRVALVASPSAAGRRVAAALARYFVDPWRPFSVPVDLDGTEFQQRVWRALCRIPAGRVRCYGDIARELKSSARAVGNACRANPIPIIIPCHRVVAVNGLGGFMGRQTGRPARLKQWLLEHERRR